jgi:AcrR family transcriptional regulator
MFMEETEVKKPGSPYFKCLSRKDYVIKANEIIGKEGVEAISIRRIAAELGCSSASMYRYFKNLDELLFYAQLDALTDYILDLSKREKEWKDIWDMHFGIWRSYALEAFKNPKAFEIIFYRNIDKDLEEALKEYYEMFPEAIVLVSPFLKEMLEIPGYYERDYHVCQMLVKKGKITAENAKKLNHMICTLFLGYFKFIQEKGIRDDEILDMTEQFIGECREIASLYAIDFTSW